MMLGKRNITQEKWNEIILTYLDKFEYSPRELSDVGVFVVSKRLLPRFYGHMIYHSEQEDRVLVIASPEENLTRWVWEGSISQYHSQWKKDV